MAEKKVLAEQIAVLAATVDKTKNEKGQCYHSLQQLTEEYNKINKQKKVLQKKTSVETQQRKVRWHEAHGAEGRRTDLSLEDFVLHFRYMLTWLFVHSIDGM